MKRVLRVPTYVRYVDDMFLFGDTRAELRAWRAAVQTFLADHLHLRLKHENAPILSCRGHLDGLGMRIRRGVIEPLPVTWRRLRDRLGRHVRGKEVLSPDAMRQALASAVGHAFFG